MAQNKGFPSKKPGISIVSDKVREDRTDPLVKQIESEVNRLKLSDNGTMGLKPAPKMKKTDLTGP